MHPAPLWRWVFLFPIVHLKKEFVVKPNLESIVKALAWPLGLIAVFSAVLALFGVSLDMVIAIAVTMVGAQALISLLVDVLKWSGVVNDGTAGKWSAAFNLLGLAGIAIGLYLNPAFDFNALDVQFQTLAQFAVLIFGYIIQIAGSKRVHQLTVRGLGVTALSASSA
jgi:hypothetical protein